VVTLGPCHVSVTLRPAAYCRKSYRCDCNRSSSPSPVSISPNFLSKHLPWFCLTERGSCMHSHSHGQRLDHLLYYLSILLGPMVALWRNVYLFRRLGYNAAPHFAPGWKREGARKQKKPCTVRSSTIERYWLHSASRNRPPLLRNQPCLKLLSFYPWPGIARLLRRWRLNVLLGPNPSRKLYAPSPPSHSGVPWLCYFRFRFFQSTLHILKLGIKRINERSAAQLSSSSLNVERPESGLVKQLNGGFSKTVSMEVYPTHTLTHHVTTLCSGVSAMLSVSEFFQRVLEDDESKACSPPTPDRRKISFYFNHTESTQYDLSPSFGTQGREG
jgi:hypothetical protein